MNLPIGLTTWMSITLATVLVCSQASEAQNPLRRSSLSTPPPIVQPRSTGNSTATTTRPPMSRSTRSLADQTPPDIRRILFPETVASATSREPRPSSPAPLEGDSATRIATASPPPVAANSVSLPIPHTPVEPSSVARRLPPAEPLEPAVVTASFDQVPPRPIPSPAGADPQNALQRLKAQTGYDRQLPFQKGRATELLQRLAGYTCLVLVLGVGFIVILKRWQTPGAAARTDGQGIQLQIRSTLKLSPKASLHIITAGDQRIMVARDANGIQSVVPLTRSFVDTLGQLDQPEPTESAGETATGDRPRSPAPVESAGNTALDTNDALVQDLMAALEDGDVKTMIQQSLDRLA